MTTKADRPDDREGVLSHQDPADPRDEAVRDHLPALEEDLTGERYTPERTDLSGSPERVAPAEGGSGAGSTASSGIGEDAADATSSIPADASTIVSGGAATVDPAWPVDTDAPAPDRPPTEPLR